MQVLQYLTGTLLITLDSLTQICFPMTRAPEPCVVACDDAPTVVTDLTISFCSPPDTSASDCALDPTTWHRLEKDLYLHASQQRAWLYTSYLKEQDLTAHELVLVDVRIGELSPGIRSNKSWERRPGGIWGW